MRKILFILCFIPAFVSAQYDSTKLRQNITAYGFNWKNGKFGTLVMPSDTTKMAVSDSNSVAFVNGIFYRYNGWYWENTVNVSLPVYVDTMFRQNDSLVYKKNGVEYNLGALNGVDSIWLDDGGSDPDTLRYRFLGATITVGIITGGGSGLSDGDKGDITVSSSGAVWTIDNLAVTNAKINDVAWSKITGAPSFLTTETDPVYSASSWFSTTNNSSNWNTSFGWGNHAGLYRPIAYVPSWSDITSKPTTLSGYGITTPIAIADGGTGQSSGNAALNALLPSQGSNANKYLKTDGSNTSWETVAGGAAALNNVGTGYDLAQQGTDNVKRLAMGYGMIADSTSTTVTLKVDTVSSNGLATKWFAQNSLGYDTTKTGTYAQMKAIVSPYTGYVFYCTDYLEGLWTFNGNGWLWNNNLTYSAMYSPVQQQIPHWGTYQYTSGSGALFTNQTTYENKYLHIVNMNTGTTSSGYAILASGGPVLSDANNISDSAITYMKMVLKVPVLGNSTDNFTINLGATTGAPWDTLSAGSLFYNYAVNSGKLVWKPQTTNRIETNYTLDTEWHVLVFKYKSNVAYLYMDGVLISSFAKTNNIGFPLGIEIIKLAGTTNRAVQLAEYWVSKAYTK